MRIQNNAGVSVFKKCSRRPMTACLSKPSQHAAACAWSRVIHIRTCLRVASTPACYIVSVGVFRWKTTIKIIIVVIYCRLKVCIFGSKGIYEKACMTVQTSTGLSREFKMDQTHINPLVAQCNQRDQRVQIFAYSKQCALSANDKTSCKGHPRLLA